MCVPVARIIAHQALGWIPLTFALELGNDPADQPGAYSNPLLDRLDPDDGRRLLALSCDLAWATTWMADANEVISPRLGLPELPVVDWPDSDDEPPHGLHWKTGFTTSIRSACWPY